MNKVIEKMGFTKEKLDEYGKILELESKQKTPIFCLNSKCNTHLFNFIGSTKFVEKALRIEDLEPIGNQTHNNLCHKCNTSWIHLIKIGTMNSGHLKTNSGWIPETPNGVLHGLNV